MSATVQLHSKGTLTIPASLRQKYSLEEGAVFTLVDLGDGSFYLTPNRSNVPEFVAEMTALRKEAGITIEELLEGLTEQRQRLYAERQRAIESME